MRRARVMFVQMDRQLLAQLIIHPDRALEKLLLYVAREVGPKPERGCSDHSFEL
jgi:hypothetical protein